MIRVLTIICVVIASIVAADAQISTLNMPMVPYVNPTGPAMSGGLGGAMIPGNIGNAPTPPPPTCSNSLDFSDGCNSQYLGMMRL